MQSVLHSNYNNTREKKHFFFFFSKSWTKCYLANIRNVTFAFALAKKKRKRKKDQLCYNHLSFWCSAFLTEQCCKPGQMKLCSYLCFTMWNMKQMWTCLLFFMNDGEDWDDVMCENGSGWPWCDGVKAVIPLFTHSADLIKQLNISIHVLCYWIHLIRFIF